MIMKIVRWQSLEVLGRRNINININGRENSNRLGFNNKDNKDMKNNPNKPLKIRYHSKQKTIKYN